MEVQEITLNYFAWPQPRDLNFYVMMVIQKILLSVVSKLVVGVWDGLDACEISRPEILSQSAPGSYKRLYTLFKDLHDWLRVSVTAGS